MAFCSFVCTFLKVWVDDRKMVVVLKKGERSVCFLYITLFKKCAENCKGKDFLPEVPVFFQKACVFFQKACVFEAKVAASVCTPLFLKVRGCGL